MFEIKEKYEGESRVVRKFADKFDVEIGHKTEDQLDLPND